MKPLTCPKCKSLAKVKTDMFRGYYVECAKCGLRGNVCATMTNARRAWKKVKA